MLTLSHRSRSSYTRFRNARAVPLLSGAMMYAIPPDFRCLWMQFSKTRCSSVKNKQSAHRTASNFLFGIAMFQGSTMQVTWLLNLLISTIRRMFSTDFSLPSVKTTSAAPSATDVRPLNPTIPDPSSKILLPRASFSCFNK